MDDPFRAEFHPLYWNDIGVIELSGTLDAANGHVFTKAVEDAVAHGATAVLVLDSSELVAAPEGVNAIRHALSLLPERAELIVAQPPPAFHQALLESGVADLIRIDDNVDDAKHFAYGEGESRNDCFIFMGYVPGEDHKPPPETVLCRPSWSVYPEAEDRDHVGDMFSDAEQHHQERFLMLDLHRVHTFSEEQMLRLRRLHYRCEARNGALVLISSYADFRQFATERGIDQFAYIFEGFTEADKLINTWRENESRPEAPSSPNAAWWLNDLVTQLQPQGVSLMKLPKGFLDEHGNQFEALVLRESKLSQCRFMVLDCTDVEAAAFQGQTALYKAQRHLVRVAGSLLLAAGTGEFVRLLQSESLTASLPWFATVEAARQFAANFLAPILDDDDE